MALIQTAVGLENCRFDTFYSPGEVFNRGMAVIVLTSLALILSDGAGYRNEDMICSG
jgi:hypothetical protein